MHRGYAAGLTLDRLAPVVEPGTGAAGRDARAGNAVFGLFVKVVLGFAAALLIMLWRGRNEGYLTAETGLGYGLGIAGTSAMLLLLLYSARKRLRFMRNLGSIQVWFQMHMFLGVLGPAMIIAHSNFKLGSTNSRVALYSMLLVAGSGLIGRFIYAKIHQGLYGRRLHVQQLAQEVDQARLRLEPMLAPLTGLQKRLGALESRLRRRPRGFLGAVTRAAVLAVGTRWLRLFARLSIAGAMMTSASGTKAPRRERRALRREVRSHLAVYLSAVRKEAELTVYERLFALWHILHVPLFFLLVLAAAAHVLAVHIY